MTFLHSPAEPNLLGKRSRQRRKKCAESLLDRFGQAFPEVTYELFWDSPTVNAQAWRLGSARYVRVYGGLTRHPAVTKCGLALIVAHETGHHLGGPPYDLAMPWLTWQGQADYWAASRGMPLVWGISARTMTLKGAREIVELHQSFVDQFDDDDPDLSADCRYQIFRSGALGEDLPSCAQDALALASNEDQF